MGFEGNPWRFCGAFIRQGGIELQLRLNKRLPMSHHQAQSFIIVGVTNEGRQFRPSDWADRLCGVMSAFGAERRMTYSPYAQPGSIESHKCVRVDSRIRDIEPMAYTFLVNFAKDNNLKIAPWNPSD